MKFIRNKFTLIALAVSCVAVGGAVSAIASAGASPSTSSSSTARAGAARRARAGALRVLRHAVHGDLVVPTKNGLVTITFDRGTVQSVTGQQLAINEGTRAKTYRTVTLTIPANARVRDNGSLTSLDNLKPGQRVLVVQGPKLWRVIARTPRTP
jgi:hypothetical protein